MKTRFIRIGNYLFENGRLIELDYLIRVANYLNNTNKLLKAENKRLRRIIADKEKGGGKC